MKNTPVFIVDNDKEELDMVQEIWEESAFENSLEVFADGEALIRRLKETGVNPFLIISDVNLARKDGFALRETLAKDPSLAYKSIPFIFWSTAASNEQIKRAYDSGGHGFFLKGTTYSQITTSLNLIIAYWKASMVPKAPKFIENDKREDSHTS